MDRCEHKGCKNSPKTGYSLYNAGKGTFCAKHFGGKENESRQAFETVDGPRDESTKK